MTATPSVIHFDPDILGGAPVFIGTRVPAERGRQPVRMEFGQQVELAPFESVPPCVPLRQVGQLALHTDELAARVAMFVQPVGVDEAWRVVGRVGADGGQEGSVGGHDVVCRTCQPGEQGWPWTDGWFGNVAVRSANVSV